MTTWRQPMATLLTPSVLRYLSMPRVPAGRRGNGRGVRSRWRPFGQGARAGARTSADACVRKKDLSLNGGGFALAQQCPALGEGGLVREGGEEVACFAQRRLRIWLAQRRQAAAVAEQGVGALGNVPELAPALGRLLVELGSSGVVARGFGELGLGRGEGVLAERGGGFGAGGESLGEGRVVEGERDAQHGGELRAEFGADGSELVELVQQRLCLLGLALGEQELGGGSERDRDEPC